MAFAYSQQLGRLKYVGDEVMTPVITSRRGVIVVPTLVVNRDSHFWWVTVVHTIGTAIVRVAPIVLRVSHIGIVIKPIHVSRCVLVAPVGAVGWRLCLGRLSLANHRKRETAGCGYQ